MRVLSFLLAAVLLLSACGTSSDDPEQSEDAPAGGLNIVASDPLMAHLVGQVTGDEGAINTLIGLGEDIRDFEVGPDDAELLHEADVFVESGRYINDALTAFVLEEAGEDLEHIILGDTAISEDEIMLGRILDHETHAHRVGASTQLWGDVTYARRYVRSAARQLGSIDPDSAADYEANAEAFAERLDALDDAIRAAVGTIPEENRKFVVASDEWSYFARRYRLELHELYKYDPGANPEDEFRELRDEVIQLSPSVLFDGPNLADDQLQQIAEEAGVEILDAPPTIAYLSEGSKNPERAYEAMMAAAARAIVEGLGGDASALDDLDL